jgi:hypothetical protein
VVCGQDFSLSGEGLPVFSWNLFIYLFIYLPGKLPCSQFFGAKTMKSESQRGKNQDEND